MAFGFITHYDKATGVGWLDTATLDANKLPFFVVPGTEYKVGDRLRFNIGQRAIQLEVDTTELGERIG